MVLLYMTGSGLDNASCALVGQALGANNISAAKGFYSTFRIIASLLIGLIMLLQWTFREVLVDMYTNIPSVRTEALSAIYLLLFNIFPDLFKGMLKGIIKAKGIQHKAVWVHLLCHWMIFPTSTWLFAFHYKWGLVGLWLAKIILEWSVVTCYTFIIWTTPWEESA